MQLKIRLVQTSTTRIVVYENIVNLSRDGQITKYPEMLKVKSELMNEKIIKLRPSINNNCNNHML